MRELVGLLELRTLHNLLDIVAHDDDDDGHYNNRSQQPTTQDQEQQRQRGTSNTSHMSRLMTFPIHLIC
jgi:FtsZ-interacting cell division protein YlmF